MSSGKEWERYARLQATVGKLLLDGKREVKDVSDVLQRVVDENPASKKFALLADLGVITVPDDYDHGTALTTFARENRTKFFSYDDNITDQNFPNPTRVLKPGQKLRVRAFGQLLTESATLEERLVFLKTQQAIYLGAQGAALVFEEMRDQLPKGYRYASFDGKELLWKSPLDRRGTLNVHCHWNGGFAFGLLLSDCVWSSSTALLCFSELPADEAGVFRVFL